VFQHQDMIRRKCARDDLHDLTQQLIDIRAG
jgi:hypothetical protein